MLIGEHIGPFLVEAELGSGAMGTVYRAVYTKTGVNVALKVVAMGLLGNESAMARFEREMNILKQLKHPNIVRLLATGRFRGTPFLAMEFIDGETLEDVLERRKRHSWEEVVDIGKQVCAALQHAHEKGIVHRDLKPANLMITRDNVVKLTDFGIAKDVDVTALTGAGSTIGTAAYMSPEQCKGDRNLGPKSDLYSLGIVLYELLTGKKPFLAETPLDMFMLHVHEKAERPSRLVLDCPVWLDNLICQLMEKKPEHRPRDAEMVARLLDEVREKMTKQVSAGVATARARHADQPAGFAGVSGEDREVAKSLRAKKKKTDKKPPPPLYAQKRVQAAGLALALLGLLAFGWYMTRPPAAERLYNQARAAMNGDNEEAMRAALEEYLRFYATTASPQTEQVKAWDRKLKVDQLERAIIRRRSIKIGNPNMGDETAQAAMRADRDGEAKISRERWQAVREKHTSPDPETAVWAWLAERRLDQQQQADTVHPRLTEEVSKDRLAGKQRERLSEIENRAVLAVRYEVFGDLPTARDLWTKLAQDCDTQPEQYVWFLVAARQAAAATTVVGKPDATKDTPARRKLLADRLAEIRQKQASGLLGEARMLCQDLLDLYTGHPDKELTEFVKQAEQIRKDLDKPAR